MTNYATTISVRKLRVGMSLVTKEDQHGVVKASLPIKSISPCHHDSHGRYVHVNDSKCFTQAGNARVVRES